MRYLLKSMIPLGFILLTMQGVAFLHDAVKRYQSAGGKERA